MKRLFFLVIVIVCLLTACNKRECKYADQAYDDGTKKCECLNDPVTIWGRCKGGGEYWSVAEVAQKYTRRVKSPEEYPYYGDTVKFHGWFYVTRYISETRTDTMYDFNTLRSKNVGDMVGAPNYGVNLIYDERLLDAVDVTQEVYVTGVLEVPTKITVPISYGECFEMPYYFRLTEMNN